MTQDAFAHLRGLHTMDGLTMPSIVLELAGPDVPELAWRNDLGGLTFRLGDRYLKWNPRTTGIDLARERVRMEWLEGRHPVPRVLASGGDADAQWLLTAAIPGEPAVGDRWRARRSEAIAAIAAGLRAFHALPVAEVPAAWARQSWVGRTPAELGPRPPIDTPVVVHGDACAPNTLLAPDGRWVGTVDLADVGVGDRWADLAIAALSLDWNYGEGHQEELYAAYGIAPDARRIAWYRALWERES